MKVTSLVLGRERISDLHRIHRVTVHMDHVSRSHIKYGQPLFSASVCLSMEVVPDHSCWLLLL